MDKEKVAKYIAYAMNLKSDDGQWKYDMANAMSFELAMTISGNIYRSIGKALLTGTVQAKLDMVSHLSCNYDKDPLIGGVRPDEIIYHAPNIGKEN